MPAPADTSATQRSARFLIDGGTRFKSLSRPYFSVMAVMPAPAMVAASPSGVPALPALSTRSPCMSAPWPNRSANEVPPPVARAEAIWNPICPSPPAISVPMFCRSVGVSTAPPTVFSVSPGRFRICDGLVYQGISVLNAFCVESAAASRPTARRPVSTLPAIARAATSFKRPRPDRDEPAPLRAPAGRARAKSATCVSVPTSSCAIFATFGSCKSRAISGLVLAASIRSRRSACFFTSGSVASTATRGMPVFAASAFACAAWSGFSPDASTAVSDWRTFASVSEPVRKFSNGVVPAAFSSVPPRKSSNPAISARPSRCFQRPRDPQPPTHGRGPEPLAQ